MSASLELKDAVSALLDGLPPLTAVYDGGVPDGVSPAYPYAIVGDNSTPEAVLTIKRHHDEDNLEVRVWATARTKTEWMGRRQADEALAAVVSRLDGARLALPGRRPARLRKVLAFTMGDPDEKHLVQGIARFRFTSRPE